MDQTPKEDELSETPTTTDGAAASTNNPNARKRKIDALASSNNALKNSRVVPPKDLAGFRSQHHAHVLYGADIAPTPHGPVTTMPPTPAFHKAAAGGDDSTPCFEDTPTDTAPASATNSFRNAAETANGNETCTSACTSGEESNRSQKSASASPAPRPAAPNSNLLLTLRNFTTWHVTPQYKLVRLLGKGSYGQVAEAYDTVRQKKVAIKKIVNVFDQEIDCKRLYREIYILRHLTHPQVIKLLDVIPPENFDSFTDLYLVFEFVDTDLHKLIMSPQYLTIRHIQVFLYQLLCGLKYIHSSNVIHRDMKPANILLNEDCTLVICDFGLSRVLEHRTEDTDSRCSADKDASTPHGSANRASTPSANQDNTPQFKRQLTKHVVTRWYRAPELILLQDYNFAVDMWSVGCIFAELLSMQVESCPRYQERVPLFPGRSCFPLSADRPTTYSDKLDQLNVIFNVIGTPGENDIGSLGEVKQYLRKLPKKEPRDLREMYPGAPADSLDLLKRMLAFNPDRRISVAEALEHPFLQAVRRIQTEAVEPHPFNMEIENVQLNKGELKSRIFEEIQLFAKRNNR